MCQGLRETDPPSVMCVCVWLPGFNNFPVQANTCTNTLQFLSFSPAAAVSVVLLCFCLLVRWARCCFPPIQPGLVRFWSGRPSSSGKKTSFDVKGNIRGSEGSPTDVFVLIKSGFVSQLVERKGERSKQFQEIFTWFQHSCFIEDENILFVIIQLFAYL